MKNKQDFQNSDLYESRYHIQERRSTARFFFTIVILVWSIMVALTCWRSMFGGIQVSGSSMENTLMSREYLLVRYCNDIDKIPHGTIIVLDIEHYPEVQADNRTKPADNQTKYIVKRLIGKAGDRVRCTDGVVEVWYAGADGYEELYEPYAKYKSNKKDYDFGEYIVGEGEIFFLGDNRCLSLDSRYREEQSHLSDRLYKETDVYGYIPEWAINNKDVLEPIFFWRELLSGRIQSRKK